LKGNTELHQQKQQIFRVGKTKENYIFKIWMSWAGIVARVGETRNVYRLLVGKPEGKRPLGRPRRKRVDYIKIDLL
jgi:hypothetical protein